MKIENLPDEVLYLCGNTVYTVYTRKTYKTWRSTLKNTTITKRRIDKHKFAEESAVRVQEFVKGGGGR